MLGLFPIDLDSISSPLLMRLALDELSSCKEEQGAGQERTTDQRQKTCWGSDERSEIAEISASNFGHSWLRVEGGKRPRFADLEEIG